jgi:hypothetical protein
MLEKGKKGRRDGWGINGEGRGGALSIYIPFLKVITYPCLLEDLLKPKSKILQPAAGAAKT